MKKEDLLDKPTLLIVDDEWENVETFASSFRKDWKCLKAKSGEEALQILSEHPEVSVIVSDQRMPNMTGVEFLRRTKEKYPYIPRLLLTGYTDLEAAIEAVNEGNIFGYIQKPYKKDKTFRMLCDAYGKYSEDMHIRQAIMEAREMIRQRFVEMFDSYTGGVAHFVNNGIVSAVSFMSILKIKMNKALEGAIDDEYFDNFYKQVMEDLKTVSHLTHTLLSMREIDINQFQHFEVAELLNFPGGENARKAQLKNVAIKIEPETQGYKVLGHKGALRQVMDELILNAIDASPEQGQVEIKSKLINDLNRGHQIEIEIKDNGIGIPKEHLTRLFDPFYRTYFGGDKRGLGLTYAFLTMLRHGGDIRIDSDLQKGTKVKLVFPLVA